MFYIKEVKYTDNGKEEVLHGPYRSKQGALLEKPRNTGYSYVNGGSYYTVVEAKD